MFHKILVAIDRSPSSRVIYEEALALAQAHHAALMLLHVLYPLDSSYPSPVYPMVDSVYPALYDEAMKTYTAQIDRMQKEGVEMLRSLTTEATNAGVATEFSQNLGDPGRVICTLARTWEADLIVVGRRGHSGLSEILLGSVSNYVLHHAPCSVLTIQGLGHEPNPAQTSDVKSCEPLPAVPS